jgi:hypothetical protein
MKKIAAVAMSLAILGATFIATSAEARPAWKTRVNHRQARQQNRLYHGVQNDSLTRREHRNLQKRQAKLAATEARFRASGNGLTPAEAAKLENRQDNLSKSIYKQKHDNQTQPQ